MPIDSGDVIEFLQTHYEEDEPITPCYQGAPEAQDRTITEIRVPNQNFKVFFEGQVEGATLSYEKAILRYTVPLDKDIISKPEWKKKAEEEAEGRELDLVEHGGKCFYACEFVAVKQLGIALERVKGATELFNRAAELYKEAIDQYFERAKNLI